MKKPVITTSLPATVHAFSYLTERIVELHDTGFVRFEVPENLQPDRDTLEVNFVFYNIEHSCNGNVWISGVIKNRDVYDHICSIIFSGIPGEGVNPKLCFKFNQEDEQELLTLEKATIYKLGVIV